MRTSENNLKFRVYGEWGYINHACENRWENNLKRSAIGPTSQCFVLFGLSAIRCTNRI